MLSDHRLTVALVAASHGESTARLPTLREHFIDLFDQFLQVITLTDCVLFDHVFVLSLRSRSAWLGGRFAETCGRCRSQSHHFQNLTSLIPRNLPYLAHWNPLTQHTLELEPLLPRKE